MTEVTNHFQQIQSNAIDCPPQNKQGIQTREKDKVFQPPISVKPAVSFKRGI